jgi:hypothetical protein
MASFAAVKGDQNAKYVESLPALKNQQILDDDRPSTLL